MSRKIISTSAAPAAIGTYSQAVQAGNTIYLSGQIGLDPTSMQMVDGIDGQIVRVFENLKAVAAAAGVTLNEAVKFNIYLTDLTNFAKVNETMAKVFVNTAGSAVGNRHQTDQEFVFHGFSVGPPRGGAAKMWSGRSPRTRVIPFQRKGAGRLSSRPAPAAGR